MSVLVLATKPLFFFPLVFTKARHFYQLSFFFVPGTIETSPQVIITTMMMTPQGKFCSFHEWARFLFLFITKVIPHLLYTLLVAVLRDISPGIRCFTLAEALLMDMEASVGWILEQQQKIIIQNQNIIFSCIANMDQKFNTVSDHKRKYTSP